MFQLFHMSGYLGEYLLRFILSYNCELLVCLLEKSNRLLWKSQTCMYYWNVLNGHELEKITVVKVHIPLDFKRTKHGA